MGEMGQQHWALSCEDVNSFLSFLAAALNPYSKSCTADIWLPLDYWPNGNKQVLQSWPYKQKIMDYFYARSLGA